MAMIIKNQILKHLSRFVKNLSADRINLSTLKGEGELTDIELDEIVLTDLLALPTWMKITKATCNRVFARIPWTKLKSVPIMLSLDEVLIKIETCEELRQGGASNAFASSMGKYGFVNKVIDGITVTVNSVEITFQSQAFESKVQISRIRVESRSPQWKRVDLSLTRLKDIDKDETLIFKEMEWQTLRIESRSTADTHLAPLRLLTNQARARIVIKKKMKNCQVLGVRLSLLLDDLLWVLTDSQILAALHFVKSLSGLVKQATEVTQRIKAARKLEQTLPSYQTHVPQQSSTQSELRTDSKKIFDIFDVKETSYHLVCEKLDLHFCDDPGPGRSQHPDLKDGGALQLSLTQVMVDFYPYHLALGSRKSWPKYNKNNPLAQWVQTALTGFRIELIESVSSLSMHSPLARAQNHGVTTGSETNQVRNAVQHQLGELMSTCLVLKVQDLRLFKVTTSSKREIPQPFISSHIEKPKDLSTVHVEFTWFYYPRDVTFPLPSPKIYAYLYPIQVHLDVCTVLWLNAFVNGLQNSLAFDEPPSDADYVDIRVEMIMPKVVFENKTKYSGQKDRPEAIHFQASRIILSNFRSNETGTLHQLTQCLDLLQTGGLAFGDSFPSKSSDAPLVAPKFVSHAEGQDTVRPKIRLRASSFQEIAPNLTKDLMWTEARDVWYLKLESLWADFIVSSKKKSSANSEYCKIDDVTKMFPFINSVTASAWVHIAKSAEVNSTVAAANQNRSNKPWRPSIIQAIFNATGSCSVQISHYQFLFLMRMVEALSELSLYITLDMENIAGPAIFDNMFSFLGVLPTVEVSLLFPLTPEKEESQSSELQSMVSEISGVDIDNLSKNVNNLLRPDEPFAGKTDLSSFSHLASSSPSVNVCTNPTNSPMVSSGDHIRSSVSHGMKQGLSSLAVAFNKGLSTPDSEVASTWSNLSDESSDNKFTHLDLSEYEGEMGVSPIPDIDRDDIEVATEVVEDDDSLASPELPNGKVLVPADNDYMVGVLTARLDGVEAAQEAKGLNSILKLQCKSLSLKESSCAWSEFQVAPETREEKFGEKSKKEENEAQTLYTSNSSHRRVLKLRLVQTIDGNHFKSCMMREDVCEQINLLRKTNPRINLTDRPGSSSPIRAFVIEATKPFLEARVDLTNEDELTIHMSSVIGLTDLVEDEIIPDPFPLKLEVVGVKLKLLEDRPSPNITSPGPIPIRAAIPYSLAISRNDKGVFIIGEESDSGTSLRSNEDENMEMKEHIKRLVSQLSTAQKRTLELEEKVAEAENLKTMVIQLQTQLHNLQEEKLNRYNALEKRRASHK